MIDQEHWDFVDELMERFELPPLPEGTRAGGVVGWTEDVARDLVEVSLAHPIRADRQRARIAAEGHRRPRPRARREGRRARGQGAARAASREQRRRHRDRAGLRGGRPHRRDRDDGARARGGRGGVAHARARGRWDRHRARRSPASLALGAQGVWMGSLWLTTAESSSSPEGIEAYLEASSSDTVRSRSLHRQAGPHAAQRVDRRVGRPGTGPVRSACPCRTSSPPRPTRASRVRTARISCSRRSGRSSAA